MYLTHKLLSFTQMVNKLNFYQIVLATTHLVLIFRHQETNKSLLSLSNIKWILMVLMISLCLRKLLYLSTETALPKFSDICLNCIAKLLLGFIKTSVLIYGCAFKPIWIVYLKKYCLISVFRKQPFDQQSCSLNFSVQFVIIANCFNTSPTKCPCLSVIPPSNITNMYLR